MSHNRVQISATIALQLFPLTLFIDDVRVDEVQPKVLRLLSILANNINTTVSHDHLIERLWGGNFVIGRQGVVRTINKLRSVLSKEIQSSCFIESYYGEGYSLVVSPVQKQKSQSTFDWLFQY